MQNIGRIARWSGCDSKCGRHRYPPSSDTRRYPSSRPIQVGRLHSQYHWGSGVLSYLKSQEAVVKKVVEVRVGSGVIE